MSEWSLDSSRRRAQGQSSVQMPSGDARGARASAHALSPTSTRRLLAAPSCIRIPRLLCLAMLICLGIANPCAKRNKAAMLEAIYRDYMVVKTCYDIDYLDDANLELARTAVRAKQHYLSSLQSIDTQSLWEAAAKASAGMLQLFRMGATEFNESMHNFCSDAFVRVTWPSNGYQPGRMKKDF